MTKIIFVFMLLFLSNVIKSQIFHGKYSNECEYLEFLDDSLLKYSIYIPLNEKVVARYCGYGYYYYNDSNLIVRNNNFLKADTLKPNEYCSICFNNKKITDKYIFNYNKDGSLFLKGPILRKYEKYNKISIRRLFLPWRKHWYDPMERILINN